MASHDSENDRFAKAGKWTVPAQRSESADEATRPLPAAPPDEATKVMPAAQADDVTRAMPTAPAEEVTGAMPAADSGDATRPMPVAEATRVELGNLAPAEELARVPAPAEPLSTPRPSRGLWLAAAAAVAALLYLFLAR